MAGYSIKDLEQLSGIKAHTLRIWEKRYNIVEPKRTETNIRFYDDTDLKKVLNIALLNKKGLRISYLAKLNDSEICSKIRDLTSGESDQETQLNSLIISMVELDEKKFEKVLSHLIMLDGFEKTLINTIQPFFEKVAVLWLTGAITPAQEHFISNLVRQKLIVAIDGLIPESSPDSKSFLLFLPEGELHELGLLFQHYLLKKRGLAVTYLGQSVPFDDLEKILLARPADYIVTAFYSSISVENVNHYLEKLGNHFPNQKILVRLFNRKEVEEKIPENVIILENSTAFHKFLNEAEIN